MTNSRVGLLALQTPVPVSSRRRAERIAEAFSTRLHEMECPADLDASAVLRAADEEILDAIVVAAPAAADSPAATERTIAQLVHDAPITIVVLRPSRARKERVLVALDVDTTDPQHQVLHDLLLDLAPGLAGSAGEIRVAHAWELYDESALGGSGFARTVSDQLDQMVRDEHDRLASRMGELVGESSISPERVETMLLHGPRTEEIRSALDRTRSTMLVIGTVGRHGLRGLLVGNTAESMLRSVKCSVAVVRVPVLD